MAQLIAQARRPRGHERTPAVRLVLLLIALVLLLPRVPAMAQNGGALEQSVKAAFLYKFAAYVEWPPERQSSGPLVIGVAGTDEVARELVRLAANRTVGTRPLAIRRLREGDTAADVHVLFIGRDYPRSVEPLLRSAQRESVLTVTESDDAFVQGSVINFKLVEGRVRFDVSLPAADRSNLRLSSRLLGVAHRVLKG